ncbi:XRE family transcriptional regulator [Brevibacillus humidisoli]|uniref:helix-turn-helix domain-containing protein n=1 Tax=Brevibacillus humidisoli TaxID=2895522 RepID=UPI001E640A6D|nr:XRE family transcriptional regulator [Brevibacillus humidisoli]UFJ40846.1 XRE family transcriptional regulator [Brevibacillus humidisoli]
MDIGTTIRTIRKRKGITIAQLCEGTGLSKGFMSQVENNKTSPSISTLDTIAKYLNVPLAYLVLAKEERMRVVRKDERQTSLFREDLKVEHLADEGGLRLMMIEIPVGYPEKEEPHAHDGEECHLVLRGRLLAQQGEDMVVLEEGDTFSWKSCVPHLVKNIGEEPALLLIASYSEQRKEGM